MKLTGWVVLISVMLSFLSLVGFTTIFSPILSNVGIDIVDGNIDNLDVESSNLFERLFNPNTAGGGSFLASLAVLGTLIAGLYLTTKDTNLLAIPFIVFIGTLFASSFWSIILTVDAGWMRNIVGLIFGGLMLGFITSCIDYFLGR